MLRQSIAALLTLICTATLFAQTRVAVLAFKNNGSAPLAHLSGAIPDMLSTNFAVGDNIVVVERAQIEKLMGEMALGQSGVIDPSTAAQVGKMAGAQMVVIGSYVDLGKKLRIDAKVVNVETSQIVPGATKSATALSLEEIDVAVDNLSKELLAKLTGDNSTVGDPAKKGKLEIIATEFGAFIILVDGQSVTMGDDGKVSLSLGHGKHLVQVLKGVFKPEQLSEQQLMIPGGYCVRAKFGQGKVTPFETVPIVDKGQSSSAATPVASTKPVTTTSVAHNGTTTVTTKTTTGTSSGNLNVAVNPMGTTVVTPEGETVTIGIGMPINDPAINANVTVTTTTTTNGSVSHSSTSSSSANASTPKEPTQTAASSGPMDVTSFNKLRASLQKESFEDTRMSILKSAVKNKKLTCDQLSDLLSLFSFEENKIDVAKLCYPKLSDPDEFYSVLSAFSFDASKEELNQWIEEQGGE